MGRRDVRHHEPKKLKKAARQVVASQVVSPSPETKVIRRDKAAKAKEE